VTTIKFLATQISPALNRGDPSSPHTIDVACSIVNPSDGVVKCDLDATNTGVEGEYKCDIEIAWVDGRKTYCKYAFKMTIRD
jgi:hypothetical protein